VKEEIVKKAQSEYLLSIITVVLNNKELIEPTIKSVLPHLNDSIQYIVIDGVSTDGTLDVIGRYKDRINQFVSEPDQGIYDAINKGIDKSLGFYFFVLNCGDRILKMPTAELIQARSKNIDVVMFDVQLSNQTIFKSEVNFGLKLHNTIHHQGAFYRKGLNIKYDLKYKVFADFDINQKLYLQRKSFIKFSQTMSYHSLEGISQQKKYFYEIFKVVQSNFGIGYTVLSFIYFKFESVRLKLRYSIKNHLV